LRRSLTRIPFPETRLASWAPFPALAANNLRLNDEVVGAANHQKMLDVIPAHNHKLALAVEIEGVNDPEPRLPLPAVAWRLNPAAGEAAEQANEEKCGGGAGKCHGGKDKAPAREKTFKNALHSSTRGRESGGGAFYNILA
jgi:hypothetical protein